MRKKISDEEADKLLEEQYIREAEADGSRIITVCRYRP